MPIVQGLVIDAQTRCEHYASKQDVLAIKFYCCKAWYPCYKCHEACADHPFERWPRDRFDRLALLCGVCKSEFSIITCLQTIACPHCGADFNPGCSLHHHLYFEV